MYITTEPCLSHLLWYLQSHIINCLNNDEFSSQNKRHCLHQLSLCWLQDRLGKAKHPQFPSSRLLNSVHHPADSTELLLEPVGVKSTQRVMLRAMSIVKNQAQKTKLCRSRNEGKEEKFKAQTAIQSKPWIAWGFIIIWASLSKGSRPGKQFLKCEALGETQSRQMAPRVRRSVGHMKNNRGWALLWENISAWGSEPRGVKAVTSKNREAVKHNTAPECYPILTAFTPKPQRCYRLLPRLCHPQRAACSALSAVFWSNSRGCRCPAPQPRCPPVRPRVRPAAAAEGSGWLRGSSPPSICLAVPARPYASGTTTVIIIIVIISTHCHQAREKHKL